MFLRLFWFPIVVLKLQLLRSGFGLNFLNIKSSDIGKPIAYGSYCISETLRTLRGCRCEIIVILVFGFNVRVILNVRVRQ